MDFLAVAGLCSGVAAIIGLVGVFIKIGIDKGETGQRIAAVEKQTDKNTAEVAAVNKEVNELKVENTGSFSALESDIKYIIMMLGEIKDDLKAGKRRSNAATKSD